MKKTISLSIFFTLCLAVFAQPNDEVLLTISRDGKAINVTKNEFKRIYEKNNTVAVQNNKSVEDYLDLFIKFKLKVSEAKYLGYDTFPEFVKEFKGYRDQLAKPYLTNESDKDAMIKEAFSFMQNEVNVSHIMLKLDFDKATPADTLKAYQQMKAYYLRIKNGESFENIAKEVSQDEQSKANDGKIGWFTAFKYPYSFEKTAYNMPIGEVSEPFSSTYGYHILKVNAKRPTRGEIRVAHISKFLPDGITEEQKDSIMKIVKEIETKLANGDDFAQLAREYSDDQRSAENGGELPWFGTGRMIPEFEDACYALQNNGDITKTPLNTRFGWHFIKRLEIKKTATFEDAKADLESKISKGDRAAYLNKLFIDQLKKEYNFKEYAENFKPFLLLDNAYFKGSKDISKYKIGKLDKVIFEFANIKTTQNEFANYLNNAKGNNANGDYPVETFIRREYLKFAHNQLINHEDANLEKKHQAFKNLIDEYYDGILLFNIMDEKVWSRAIKDTAGLELFYNNNQNMFMWNERIDLKTFKTNDEKTANALLASLKKSEIKNISDSIVVANIQSKFAKKDSIIVSQKISEKGEDPLVDSLKWAKGISNVVPFNGKYFVFKVENIIPATPKKMDETKGLVISSYQDYLEKQWVEELRKKYAVNIDKRILSQLINSVQ